MNFLFYYSSEAPKISEDNFDKKKNIQDQGCSVKLKPEEKLLLEEKKKDYKSFEDFINDYQNFLKNLSNNKLKRLSKTYLLILSKKYF